MPAEAPASAAASEALAAVTTRAADLSCSEQVFQQLQQQQPGLLLHSYGSSLSRAVDLLATLQPHRLVQVELNLSNANTNSTALSAALARLSNLQRLSLFSMEAVNLWSALPTLGQLSQLTAVGIYGAWPMDSPEDVWPGVVLEQPVSVALQQLLCQPLPLQALVLDCWHSCPLPVFNMLNLIKLAKLDISTCQLPWESVLPAQLQNLAFLCKGGPDSLAPVTRLQLKQLRHLILHVDFEQRQPLLQLAQLPALQHLELVYSDAATAAAAAPAWALLPQLRDLVVDCPPASDMLAEHGMAQVVQWEQEWGAIVTAAAAISTITTLKLHACDICDDHDEILETSFDELASRVSVVAVCASLSRLPSLQHLSVHCGYGLGLARDDVSAFKCKFTVHTALTHLEIWGAEDACEHRVTVSTAAATALACSL
jgi:hypothetical protein